jgi:hypothetical protein
MNKFQAFIFIIIFSLFILNSCQTSVKKNNLSPEKQAELISKGKTIVGQSFKAFSREIMKALQEGGVEHAVSYCHLQTSPLVDSLSKTYKVKIMRISDKFRNPENKPGDLDLTILKAYQKQLADGQDLLGHLETKADQVIYYSPILILNPASLQCNGERGLTMDQENYDFIKSKYPEDLATGYKLGDLRGVWKIVFDLGF